MRVVMDMQSRAMEPDADVTEYGSEVMCSGWNPALTSIGMQCQSAAEGGVDRGETSLPPELAEEDVDLFLQRMYVYQAE